MPSLLHLSTAKQSAEIDETAQKEFHLSSEILMESAGAVSAEKINRMFKKQPVQVLCGPGSNGGDGLVLARHLISLGWPVQVFCSDPHIDSSSSSLLNRQKKRLKAQGVHLQNLENTKQVKQALQTGKSLILDALFGIGLSRNIEGFYLDIIEHINALSDEKSAVISLDTASGLNVDTGQIMGAAVKASHTFSFGLGKPGFYLRKGPGLSGRISLMPISFPLQVLHKTADTHFLLSEDWVSAHLPQRLPEDHKGRQGHLLVLAGSRGFRGAGQLCALSAYRMGAGYVTWACNEDIEPFVHKQAPMDVLTAKIFDPGLLDKKTAVAIGPGLGAGRTTKELLLKLKASSGMPVVVDADAFTVCVQQNLFPLPAGWLLTPHAGELGRLFQLKGEDIDKDPCFYARKASQKTGALVLLKGFYSVLSNGKKCWIIPAGNAALAKAGTGDVLTGMAGALMARGLDSVSSALVSAFVHGCLAEEWTAGSRDKDSLLAQDLKDLLPYVLQKLRSSVKIR